MFNGKRFGLAAAILLVFALGLIGCGNRAGSGGGSSAGGGGGNSNEIVIGGFFDTSGPTSTFGTSSVNAINLALEELPNQSINGKKVRFVVADDRGEPQTARTSVERLISKDGAVAVLGEVASKLSLAGGEICQRSQVPMLSPSSTNPQVTKTGDYIFRVCFIDPFQGSALANFATKTLKAKTAAILFDNKQDYSVGLADAFIETFNKLGGKVVYESSYSSGTPDFRSQLNAIKTAKPDVIVVPGYYTEMGIIARQGKGIGINVPYLGGDGWESEKLFEGAAGALEGSYFTTHYAKDQPDPRAKAFIDKYKAKYQAEPDALAATAYDAAKMLFQAIEKSGDATPKKIRDELAKIQNFPGVTGDITIDAERNAKKPIVVLRIEGDGTKFVEATRPE